MKKLLILVVTIAVATNMLAQVPRNIFVPPFHPSQTPTDTPETPCLSNAGTVTSITTFPNTQSNDVDLDTTYLCSGDRVRINHAGDFNLSGDPNPATIPGIGYGFYTCPPTITGPTLQHIVGSIALPGDNCRLVGPPAPINGIYIAANPPFNGDETFFNDGTLQTTYNGGDPYLLYFAPITFDDQSNNGYDAVGVTPPGSCTNVRVDQSFPVVYLNPIEAIGVTNAFSGNNCLGRFRVDGGASEWYENVLNNFGPLSYYDIEINLKSDPTVSALIYNFGNPSAFNHFTNVIFSVPQSGIYEVNIQDGKSCGLTFDMDMSGCLVQNSVELELPTVNAEPGEIFCLPITTTNFNDIVSFSFSVSWDPTAMQLAPTNIIQNVNGDLTGFDPASNVNTNQAANGTLGITYSGGGTANLNPSESLMSVCFRAIAPVGQDTVCVPVTISNQGSSVSIENSNGDPLAIDVSAGQVCIFFDTVQVDINITSGCDNLLDLALDISGNIAPYEVLWQRISPTPAGAVNFDDNIQPGVFNISNLAPGTWVITVIPDNGAGIMDQFVDTLVLQANELGASLNLTGFPTCNGLSNGSVTANVFLGSTLVPANQLSGFSFQWNPPGPNTPTRTNVPAGAYAVTVTQTSTGCTAVASGQLGQPAVVDNGLITTVPASCSGVDDGQLTFNVVGGTPYFGGLYDINVLYSTQPNDPAAVQFDNTRGEPYQNNTLLEGYYTIQISDSLGCDFEQEVQVTAARVVTVSLVTSSQPTCFGGTNGSAQVQVSVVPPTPGGENFTFAWVPNGVVNSTPTNSTISSIGADTFQVTAVNAAGCAASLDVIVTQPAPFIARPITVNNPTCPNPTGGAISVIGQGGSGLPNTFTFAWAAPLQSNTTSAASQLGVGTYTVTISDGNGCTAVFDTTLTLPPPPVITSIDSISVRCGGDGSLTVNAPTATAYQWTSLTGNILSTPTEKTITSLEGGVFVIRVTDANGCITRDTIVLDGVEPLFISDTTITNPSCFGYSDGSIAVGVEGGTGPYSYAWSTSAPPNSPVIIAKPAGTYSVTVTDINGCTTRGTFSLVDPPQISVLFTAVAPASCFGECDGAATPLVQYLPGSNFNFQWINGGSTDSVRVDLCSGLNQVIITEAGGNSCFIDTTVFIPSPPPVSIDTTETVVTNVTCTGDSDGAILLIPQGGNGSPYTYQWGPPAGATSSTVSNLARGGYQVTITDNNGCTGVYSTTITEPPAITIAPDAQSPKCFEGDDGVIDLDVTGGNTPAPGAPAYTYSWADATGIVGNTNPLEDLTAGNYTVTVTDSKGCTSTATVPLADRPPVTGDYTLGEPIECFGEETTITVSDLAGGNGGPYTYSIDFGVPLDPAFPSNISGGPHKISYIDRFLCETIDSIVVAEPDPILVTFNEPDGINDGVIEIQLGDSLTLSPLITGAADFDFTWTPGSFFIDSSKLQPTLYTFQSGKVTLTLVDDKGCTGMGMLRIEVDANRNVYMANIFMPGNNLGTNDYFAPGIGLGVQNINFFRIYDRWGNLMYSRDNISPEVYQNSLTEGWDGRFNGKFVDPGVYVYAMEVIFLDKKKILYRGDITVTR
jgi:hypothetical protein